MKTVRSLIDVDDGQLKIRVQDEEVAFNVFDAIKHPNDEKSCFKVHVLDDMMQSSQGRDPFPEP